MESGGTECPCRNSHEDRRPHRRKCRAFSSGRDDGQRQTDPRNHGDRRSLFFRSFPLFRRCDPYNGRHRHGSGRQLHESRSPRTDRRRRPDRSMEFPFPDGSMETGSGSRRRKLYRFQTVILHLAEYGRLHGTHRRPSPSWRYQYRYRSGQQIRPVSAGPS